MMKSPSKLHYFSCPVLFLLAISRGLGKESTDSTNTPPLLLNHLGHIRQLTLKLAVILGTDLSKIKDSSLAIIKNKVTKFTASDQAFWWLTIIV